MLEAWITREYFCVELDCFREVFCAEGLAAFCFELEELGAKKEEDTCSADMVMLGLGERALEDREKLSKIAEKLRLSQPHERT